MRALALVLVAGCSAAAAAPPDDVTELKPVAMAGPYKTLIEGCRAARPCGALDFDDHGDPTNPPAEPNCSAVVKPSLGVASGSAKVVHRLAGGAGEIRIASVTCAVPPRERLEHAEYYVFVQRGDGWWRTETPLWTYAFDDKYCGGGMYITWNDKPTRTIADIAASYGCVACGKQAEREDVVELMLRVELSGPDPLVFPPLPVGARSKVKVVGSPDKDATDPDCKPHAKLRSHAETWRSDDIVELSGADGVGGALDSTFDISGRIQPAAAGRYKFAR